MKKTLILLIVFLFTFVSAEKKNPKITDFLGQTHVDILNYYGPPNRIFPLRQNRQEEDDVVFNYQQSFFYFYASRLYRVLYTSEYTGKIYGELKIGDKKNNLTDLFGQDYTLESDGLVWRKDKYLVVAKMDSQNRLISLWFIINSQE